MGGYKHEKIFIYMKIIRFKIILVAGLMLPAVPPGYLFIFIVEWLVLIIFFNIQSKFISIFASCLFLFLDFRGRF